MAHYKVVIADGSFGGVAAGVQDYLGHTIETVIAPFGSVENVRRACADADGVVVGLQQLHEDEIAVLGPKVRAVSRGGIGLDNIDLDAARARGIAVIHQTTYATEEVATHAVALLLAVNRRLLESDKFARTAWAERKQLSQLKPLHRMTVGVIGLGLIGRAAVHKLTNLVDKILVYDPYAKDLPQGVTAAPLAQLLAASDAITLHAPLTPETRNLIGAKELAMLPQGALVINVARGELIDHGALIAALASGHIGGAGLDVFPQEPIPPGHPLLSAPNVLTSPHSAFASSEAVAKLKHQTVNDLFHYLAEGKLLDGRMAVDPKGK